MKTKLALISFFIISLAACGGGGGGGGGSSTSNTRGFVSVGGSVAEDQTLTAVISDENGIANASITYAWRSNGMLISGTNSATFVPDDEQVGFTISVTVTYVDDDGFNEQATSSETAPVSGVNDAGSISVSGTPAVGQILSASIDDVDGVPENVTYSWAADGTAIEGADAAIFTPTAAELGSTLTVSATYTDDQGFDESIESDATPAVTGSSQNAAGTISITGTAADGQTLTAAVTDTNGTSNATIVYAWAAGGDAISGATSATYLLTANEVGDTITVSASYTDDDGFQENITSAATAAVAPANMTNTTGIVSISSNGTLLVGDILTAVITDANGTAGASFNYQWEANGSDISGATSSTYTLTTAEAGSVITVNVTYIDDDGFSEFITSGAAAGEDTSNRVYSFVVDSETALVAAAAAASDGDWIALDSPVGSSGADDYTDMAEIIFDNYDLVITLTSTSTAQITGATCIQLSGNGILIDGLSFDGIDIVAPSSCNSNGNSSIYISGDDVTIRNTEILGEVAAPASDPYHWISIKGFQNTIERNLFSGKDTDSRGGVITIFANASPDDQSDHTIQYNLFKDIVGKSGVDAQRSSEAYAIQAGRSTGSPVNDGNMTIQYNRFDNVLTERRLMRVQSNNNIIRYNTIVDSVGLIALEDGHSSEASFNIILPTGNDADDGGISFAPLGHTITDNYVEDLRTTSSQRAGLLVNFDPLDGAGNTTIIADTDIDKTTVVARNSIINAQRAVQFEDSNCGTLNAILDFDNNLLVNQSSNSNGAGRNAVTEGDYVAAGCSLDPSSDFDNNHFYSQDLSDNETASAFDFNGATGVDGNIYGDEDEGDIVTGANSLFNGANTDAGIGVDTSLLILVPEANVGPGSTWVAP